MLAPEVGPAQRESLLGRTNPLVKLGIALAWLLGLGLTLDVRPPLILAARRARRRAPARLDLDSARWRGASRRSRLAALGIALANLLFSTHNPDPLATELAPARAAADHARGGRGRGGPRRAGRSRSSASARCSR